MHYNSVDAITVGLSSLDIIIKDIRKGIAGRSSEEFRITAESIILLAPGISKSKVLHPLPNPPPQGEGRVGVSVETA